MQANDDKQSQANGERIISGEIIQGGVECPLFRTDEGLEFSLAGIEQGEAPVGTKMRLRGQIMEISTCMQGTTFNVSERLID